MIRLVTLDPFEEKEVQKFCRQLYASFGVGCEHAFNMEFPDSAGDPPDAAKLLDQVKGVRSFRYDKAVYLTKRKLKDRNLQTGAASTCGYSIYGKTLALVSTHPKKDIDEGFCYVSRVAVYHVGHLWECTTAWIHVVRCSHPGSLRISMASPPSAPSAETKASTKFGWRNLSLAEAALLVAVGALSLTFDLRLPARLPSESDYRQLASVLEAEAQPGDVLLVYPWWAERARLFVPDSLRVVGYLGSEQNPLVDHPRIWVLAQPHLPRANFEAFQRAFDPGRTPLGPPRWFGTLELRLYRNEKHRPLRYAATEKLGFEWHEVEYAPYRCIRVGPPGGAAKAAIDLSNVPMTGHVELNAGVIGEQASWGGPSYTSITVTAESEGQLLTNIVIPPRREGMQSSLIKTSAGELRNLTITVQTERPEGRSVCLDLRVYGEAAQ